MKDKLQFGTDGIRGKSDQFPFTTSILNRLGLAIAQWSLKKYPKQNPSLLLCHDTRLSCKRIKHDLIQGLTNHALTITDAGVLPTPAILQLMQQEKRFDFGIVISASHNPYTDNGIKLFDATTGKLSSDDETRIVAYFESTEHTTTTPQASVTLWPEAASLYCTYLTSLFNKTLLQGKKIVLDCAHGATYQVAPVIFTALGAEVIPLNISPNGTNINKECGALHPKELQKTVLKEKADFGFAFDGDGDRVIGVNKEGTIKDGDDFLALLLQHQSFADQTTVVGTVMTNHGLAQHLEAEKKKLIRTKVGDKHIAAKLKQNNLLLGGETSGHLIIRNYINTGDGIFVALKVAESIIHNENWMMTTFTKTPQFLLNVTIEKKRDLSQPPYKEIIKAHEATLRNGRIIVRYSGTENVLRLMVEDQTLEAAKTIAYQLCDQLKIALHTFD